jgi:hypothetical protein
MEPAAKFLAVESGVDGSGRSMNNRLGRYIFQALSRIHDAVLLVILEWFLK